MKKERSTKKHEGHERTNFASCNFVDRFPPAETETMSQI